MTVPKTFSVMQTSFLHTLRFALIIMAVLFVVYAASGVYSIESSEIGVLLRFGRIIDDAVPSGIHFAFPWPIDRVIKVPVRKVVRLSVDDFYESSEIAASFRGVTGLNSYLVTGDNNIVTFSCILQYTISKPARYLFKLNNTERILHNLACTTLIHNVARLTIDDILTIGKDKLQFDIRLDLQERLDELDCGIDVTFVELHDVRPPRLVQEWFDDVINARIDREKMVNTALSYRNERIPKAKGDAERLVKEAEAYRHRVIEQARGDADRFLARATQYKLNPDITRKYLLLELFQQVLPTIQRTCIVANEGTGPLVRVVTSSGSKSTNPNSDTKEDTK